MGVAHSLLLTRGTQRLRNEKNAKNIAERVREIAHPVVSELGYELWDVEFLKVGGMYELTVFIDSPDGIGIRDCEKVSRGLNPLLDKHDPIQQAHTFYVSSAGVERTLRTPEHFAKFIGHKVDVRLFRAVEGAKHYSGALVSYEDGRITLDCDGVTRAFEPADVSSVRLVYVAK